MVEKEEEEEFKWRVFCLSGAFAGLLVYYVCIFLVTGQSRFQLIKFRLQIEKEDEEEETETASIEAHFHFFSPNGLSFKDMKISQINLR